MDKMADVPVNEKRWLVVIAGLLIIVCLGVAYAWGIFLLPISKEFGWTRASVSLAVSILLLTFSLFMAVGGLCEKKIGPGKTATAGGILVCAGWILASFTKSLPWLYMTYGVLTGIGTGLSYLPAISTGIKWFPDRKGLVTGIIIFGFGFGSAFLAPAGTKLIINYGWRTTMLIYGIVFGTVISASSFFLKVPPKNWMPDSIKNGTFACTKNVDLTPSQMLREKSFKFIFLTYFIAMVAGMMAIGHIIPFLTDSGYTAMQAAFAITILALFNGLGRISGGALSDRIGTGNTLVSLFIIIGTTVLLLNFMPSLFLIYVAAGITGLCFGGFLSVYPAITCDYFGLKNFGINYGLVFIGYGMGCFAGPWLVGMVHDATGNYMIAFMTAGITALIGGATAFLYLKKNNRGKQ